MRLSTVGVTLLSLALAGCSGAQINALDDGYQFGDLRALQQEYCRTADPSQRADLLALMRLAGIKIPPSGVCTTGVQLLNLDANVEQAEKDRARFQGEASPNANIHSQTSQD